ncbi:hypothetical protein [Natronosalvus vescus]|uniref:hypothetical protein n=1 Tax=Natronosalvus vescus TaxID=2953881 RepID=UPI002091CD17|nr:hypothetical protein [Natronosalvus vescus]
MTTNDDDSLARLWGEAGEPTETVTDLSNTIQGTIRPDEQLYHFRIGFDDISIRQKKALVNELTNALDVRYVNPAIDELASTTTAVDLVLVTSIPSAVIEGAFDPTDIASIDYLELEPNDVGVAVEEPESDRMSDVERFQDVQRALEQDGDDEADPVMSPDAEATDPTDVAFSDDEIAFEHLLEPTPDDGEDDWEASHDEGRESVVSTLVAELEAGTVDSEEIDRLRDHLGQDESRTSVGVRLEHVQARMESFAAYVDALEEFLDENGTAAQIQERLQSDLETVHDELQAAGDERQTLRSRIDTLEGAQWSEEEIETLVDLAIDDLGDDRKGQLEQLTTRIDDLEDALESQKRVHHQLKEAFA